MTQSPDLQYKTSANTCAILNKGVDHGTAGLMLVLKDSLSVNIWMMIIHNLIIQMPWKACDFV